MNIIGALLAYATQGSGFPKYIWDYYRENWLEGMSADERLTHICPACGGFDLPCKLGEKAPCKEFFDELKAWIMQDNVVIFEYNHGRYDSIKKYLKENNGEDNKLRPITRYFDSCRKDPVTGYWLLFDQRSGDKIRFRFDDEPITYASLPELVDIKITDYCDRECSYCYTDSTCNGKHAKLKNIKRIIDALAKLEVPEIVLGGGEPTKHPGIREILKYIRRAGIVPNFTTRNLDWFNEKNVKLFKKCCGKVAFSADDHEWTLQRIRSLIDIHGLRCTAIQVVDKVNNLVKVARYMRRYELSNLMCLGFKECGRGKEYIAKYGVEHKVSFADVRKSSQTRWGYGVSVDTKYIVDHYDEIEAEGISPLLYTQYEGQFSMFIDAVNGTMAESSYSGEPVAIDWGSGAGFYYELADEDDGEDLNVSPTFNDLEVKGDKKEWQPIAVQIREFFERCSRQVYENSQKGHE